MTGYSFIPVPKPHGDATRTHIFADKFKAIRLYGLEHSPHAFSSTFAREQAFDEAEWVKRLFNSKVQMFVAIPTKSTPPQLSDDDLLVSGDWVAICGLFNLTQDDPVTESASSSPDAPETVEYELVGLYTMPEYRKRGLAFGTVNRALKYAADSPSQRVVVHTSVTDDNLAVLPFYEILEFVQVEGNAIRPGHLHLVWKRQK